jgi:hypothetical protein
MPATYQAALLDSPLGLALLERIRELGPATLSDEDLMEIALNERMLLSIHRSDYSAVAAALRARRSELAPLAAWLAQRAWFWWQDLDREHQIWISTADHPPADSGLVPVLDDFSATATKPQDAFWTSTRVARVFSPWLHWLLRGEDRRPGPFNLWTLPVMSGARVAEIHSPADWCRLVREYPGAIRQEVLHPDWRRIGERWDAVHVSAGGLIVTEDQPCPGGPGSGQLLGWNMESTVWLRWCFGSPTRIDRVESLATGYDL